MTTANPGDPLGYDAAVALDIGPTGASCSGADLVTNALLHRLLEDNLPMLGAPGDYVAYGVNVRRWVGEVTTQSRADAKGPELGMVVAREPRIDPSSIVVTLTVQPAGARYNLLLAISARTTTQLPIALVYGITSATVERLASGT